MAWEKMKVRPDPLRQSGNRPASSHATQASTAFKPAVYADRFDPTFLETRGVKRFMKQGVRQINLPQEKGTSDFQAGALGVHLLTKRREVLETNLPHALQGQIADAIFQLHIPKKEALEKARESLLRALGKGREKLVEDIIGRLERDPRLERIESRRTETQVRNLEFFGGRISQIASRYVESLRALDQVEQNWLSFSQTAFFERQFYSAKIPLTTLAWNSFVLSILDMMARLSWESFQHQQEQTARLIEEAREIQNHEIRRAAIRAITMAGEIIRVVLATQESNRQAYNHRIYVEGQPATALPSSVKTTAG